MKATALVKATASAKVTVPRARPAPPTSLAPTPGPKTRGVDRNPADRRPSFAKATAAGVPRVPHHKVIAATKPAPKTLAAARKPAARRRTTSAASQAVPTGAGATAASARRPEDSVRPSPHRNSARTVAMR